MEIKTADIILCEFYFSDLKTSKQRPVLIFKDNLPYDDFVGIPISSQIRQVHLDESILEAVDFIEGGIPKTSKLMLRKPFVISKTAVIKKYGSLNQEAISNCFASISIVQNNIFRAVTDAEFISCWFLLIATTAWMQKVEQRRSSCRGAETDA